jgi:hypothetical protein
MSDRHVRILAMMARRSQRALDRHDGIAAPEASLSPRGADLRQRAARTRARLAAARARRRYDENT